MFMVIFDVLLKKKINQTSPQNLLQTSFVFTGKFSLPSRRFGIFVQTPFFFDDFGDSSPFLMIPYSSFY